MPATSQPASGPDGPAVPEMRHLAFPLEGLTLRESRDGDGFLHLAGHAAVFDKLSHDLGGFREKIDRGAFTDVLDGDPDVHLVIGHDMTRVLARTRSKTLELREDPAGLRIWARLDPDDPDVRSLVPKMKRGDVDQMSFAFSVARGGDEWLIEGDGDDERVTRTIKKNGIDGLYDVSVVAQGAYPQTDANLRGLLEAARQSGRLLREQAESDVMDDTHVEDVEQEPQVIDLASTDESEPQVDDLAPDESRTAPETPAAEAPQIKLADLKALTRTETELAKRRLMAAQRTGD